MKKFLIICLLASWQASFAQSYGWNWTKSVGVASNISVTDITSDPDGNSFVIGIFQGTNVDFGNGITLSSTSGNDGYLAKYDSSGTCQWVRLISGTNNNQIPKAIAISNIDEIFIGGNFESDIDLGNSIAATVSGTSDGFVGRFNANGIAQQIITIPGNNTTLNDLEIYQSGFANSIYITGGFSGTSIDFGNGNLASATVQNTYVAAYDLALNCDWVSTAGSASVNEGNSLAVEDPFNIFVASFADLQNNYTFPSPVGLVSGIAGGQGVILSEFVNGGSCNDVRFINSGDPNDLPVLAYDAVNDRLHLSMNNVNSGTDFGNSQSTATSGPVLASFFLPFICESITEMQNVMVFDLASSGGGVYATGNVFGNAIFGVDKSNNNVTESYSSTLRIFISKYDFRGNNLIHHWHETTSADNSGITAVQIDAFNNILLGGTYIQNLTIGNDSYTSGGSTVFGILGSFKGPFPFKEKSTSVALDQTYLGDVHWLDYDNDADLDLLIQGPNELDVYVNNAGELTTKTAAGLTQVGSKGSFDAADFDRDGFIDLIFSSTIGSRVYRNTGGNYTITSSTLPAIDNSEIVFTDRTNLDRFDAILTGNRNSTGQPSNEYVDNGFPSSIISSAYTDLGTFIENGDTEIIDFNNDGLWDVFLLGENNVGNPVTTLYENTGNDNPLPEYTISSNSFEQVRQGAAAVSDFDNDGDFDIVLTGINGSSNRFADIYRNDNGSFTAINAGLTGVNHSEALWFELNADGYPDLLLMGQADSGPLTRIYLNNQDGTFTNLGNLGLPDISYADAAWGDFDDDSDLDLALTGTTDGLSSGQITAIYEMEFNSISDRAPERPENLNASFGNGQVKVSWDADVFTNDETPPDGITYQVRLGTISGGQGLIGEDGVTQFFHKKPARGKVTQTEWIYKGALTPGDTYFWNVVGIDPAFQPGLWSFTSSFTVPEIFYVDASASGANDGSSWANAYNDLANAIASSPPGAQLWVAAGTYSSTGILVNQEITIYGGFAGNESFLEEREIYDNLTTIDGGGTSFTLFRINQNNVVIDGFTLTENDPGSSAVGGAIGVIGVSNLLIRNCTFLNCTGDLGGAIGLQSGSTNIRIENCLFNANSSNNNGGAIYSIGADVLINNCTFTNNNTNASGGAIYTEGTSTNIENCTITGNDSFSGQAGGIGYNLNDPIVINSIIWANDDNTLIEIDPGASVSYSVVKGGYPGTQNVAVDPQLNPLAHNGGPTETFSFPFSSVALNRGSVFSGQDSRGVDYIGACDIGSYEFDGTLLEVTTISNSAAFPYDAGSLNIAISYATEHTGADTIIFSAAIAGGDIDISGTPNLFENSLGEGDSTYIDGDANGDGLPSIILDGGGANPGLGITANNVTLTNLCFIGCTEAVVVNGNNFTLLGSYFGLDATGDANSSSPNDTGVEFFDDSQGHVIGGLAATDRNYFGGHTFRAIDFNGSFLHENILIQNNYFGLETDGITDFGNERDLYIQNVNGITIGTGAARNVFASTTNSAIFIFDGNNIQIENNYFGFSPVTFIELPIADYSILVDQSTNTTIIENYLNHSTFDVYIQNSINGNISNNFIGVLPGGINVTATGATPFQLQNSSDFGVNENTIANVSFDGLIMSGVSTRDNLLNANLYYRTSINNQNPPVTLFNGAQRGVRPPVITSIGQDSVVTGTSAPNAQIQLYADSTGYTAPYRIAQFPADGSGNWSFSIDPSTFPSPDMIFITAMQDSAGNSSGFSNYEAAIFETTFIVTTLADAGPGSLRDAIEKANARSGADTILFDAGIANGTITLQTDLPDITGDNTFINGESRNITIKPFTIINQLITLRGNHSRVENISLDGRDNTSAIVSEGFTVDSDSTTLVNVTVHHTTQGVSLNGTGDSLLNSHIYASSDFGVVAGVSGPGSVIQGNLIGTDAAGTTALPNNVGLAVVNDVKIGGPLPSQRNIISGNDSTGILMLGQSSELINNYIGLDISGNNILGNGYAGVHVSDFSGTFTGAFNNIGDGTASGRNIISGNLIGVLIQGQANSNDVYGNFIGTNASGTQNLGNLSAGVSFLNSRGRDSLRNNTIAFNDTLGVKIAGNASDSIYLFQNAIYSNDSLGIGIDPVSQGGILSPTITSLQLDGSISGTAAPNATVYIFADSAEEAQAFITQIMADGTGLWNATLNLDTLTPLGLDSITVQQSMDRNFSGLSIPAWPTITAPDSLTVITADQQFILQWNGVPSVSNYTVLYGTDSTSSLTSVTVNGDTTSTITGLTNDLLYFVAIASDGGDTTEFQGATPTLEAGQAAVFNGTNEILVPDTSLNLPPEFTLEAWVKPEKSTQINTIITKKIPGTSFPGFGWYINTFNTGDHKLIFETENFNYVSSTDSLIEDSVWQHIAITYDGIAPKMYKNGKEVAYFEANINPQDSPDSLIIGEFSQRPGYGFIGEMDEIRYWNRALSVNELNHKKDKPINTFQDGLIALWQFDEPAGGNVAYAQTRDYNGIWDNDSYILSQAMKPIVDTLIVRKSGNAVQASWKMVNKDSDSIRVYRNTSPAIDTSIHLLTTVNYNPLDTFYLDNAVTVGNTYYYQIAGIDSAGQIGALGDIESILFLNDAPSNFKTITTDQEVTLQWSSVTGITDYSVLYGTDSTAGLASVTITNDSTTTITGLTNDQLYFFAVTSLTGDTTAFQGAVPTLEAGRAAAFDGTRKITVPEIVDLNMPSNFTIEAWVNPKKDFEINTIISKSKPGGSNPGFAFYINSFNTGDHAIGFETNGSRISSVPNAIQDSVWQHVAVTYDGTFVKLFVNGEEPSYTITSLTIDASMDSLIIGQYTNGGGFGFIGEIDEIRYWNRALSVSELNIKKDKPVETEQEGLLAFWHFDEPLGTSAAYAQQFKYNGYWNNDSSVVSGAMRPIVDTLIAASEGDSIQVNWRFFTTDTDSVRIYRHTAPDIDTGIHLLTTVDYSPLDTFYVDNGLTIGDTLWYQVIGIDSVGQTGTLSIIDSAIVDGDPLVVTNTRDDGTFGSLRYALDFANINPGPDTVTFLLGNDTIRLDSTLYISSNDVVIDGTGNNVIIAIDTDFTSTFAVGGGEMLFANGDDLIIRNLTFEVLNTVAGITEYVGLIVQGTNGWFTDLVFKNFKPDPSSSILLGAGPNSNHTFKRNAFYNTNFGFNIALDLENIVIDSCYFGFIPGEFPPAELSNTGILFINSGNSVIPPTRKMIVQNSYFIGHSVAGINLIDDGETLIKNCTFGTTENGDVLANTQSIRMSDADNVTILGNSINGNGTGSSINMFNAVQVRIDSNRIHQVTTGPEIILNGSFTQIMDLSRNSLSDITNDAIVNPTTSYLPVIQGWDTIGVDRVFGGMTAGFGSAGYRIELFADSTDEARIYLDSTVTLADGSWEVSGIDLSGFDTDSLNFLTATATISGNTSNLSTAFQVDFTPPAPTRLAVATSNQEATLFWDQVPFINNYTVLYGTDSSLTLTPIVVNNDTTTSITGLTNDQQYFFAVASDNGDTSAFKGAVPTLQSGRSLQFNGVDQYVNLSNLGDFGSQIGNSTIELWMKSTDTLSASSLIKVIDTTDAVLALEANRFFSSPTSLVYNPGFTLFYIRDSALNVHGGHIDENIYDGNWHHIAMTYDGTNLIVFIDGNPISFLYERNDPLTNLSDFGENIFAGAGNDRGTAESYYTGEIDEVRFWTSALTADSLSKNLSFPTRKSPNELHAIWHLDEPSGTGISYDANGGQYHGTWVNNPGSITSEAMAPFAVANAFVTNDSTELIVAYDENNDFDFLEYQIVYDTTFDLSSPLGTITITQQDSLQAAITSLTNGKLYHVGVIVADDGGLISDTTRSIGVPTPKPYNKIWIGQVDSNWFEAGNWLDNAVPTLSDTVWIPNLGVLPIINSTAAVKTVDIATEAGASVTIDIDNSGILNLNPD